MRTKKKKALVLRKSLRQLKSSSHTYGLAGHFVECKLEVSSSNRESSSNLNKMDAVPKFHCNGAKDSVASRLPKRPEPSSGTRISQRIAERLEKPVGQKAAAPVSKKVKATGEQESKRHGAVSKTAAPPKAKVQAAASSPSKRGADEKLPCKVCGRAFAKAYLVVHVRTHTGERPYACAHCPKHFASDNYLRVHSRICQGGDRDLFKCHVCGRTLACNGSLKQHLRTHSDERPFECKTCSKTFKQSAMLCNHVKIHDLTPRYQCERCGAQYRSVQGLNRHRERIHEGVRHSFPCDLCGKAFTRRTKLKDHIMWHKGTSPYICSYCDRRMLSRKTLKNHLLIHENKKPFPCTVCGKAFRQNCVLKRHLTVHTGIKPFRCELCGKQFIHRTYLANHKCPLQLSDAETLEALLVGNAALVNDKVITR